MSLRERFTRAQEKQKGDDYTYRSLGAVSGDLAVLASQLPQRLEELVIRAEAGQPVYTNSYNPAMRAEFKTEYHAPYSGSYSERRDLPSRAEMEALRGYQKLLATCADEDVDVCVVINLGKAEEYGSKINVTVDVFPDLPFSSSYMGMRSYSNRYGRHSYDRESYERHEIGAEYPHSKKPRFTPALSLKNRVLDKP
jgi:hypothetical protein